MDVVYGNGYYGQSIYFYDPNNFGFAVGKSFTMLNEGGALVDLFWRDDTGISCSLVHHQRQMMVIAPDIDGTELDVIKLVDKSLIITLNNPTSGKIISLNTSANGDLLYGISDSVDHHLIVWDIKTGNILSRMKLTDGTFSKCHVNPLDPLQVALVGSNGITIVNIVEVLGEYNSKAFVLDIEISPGVTTSTTENILITTNTTAPILSMCWMTYKSIVVGSNQGYLTHYYIDTKESLLFAKVDGFPVDIFLSLNHVIVGASDGIVHWVARNDIQSVEAGGAMTTQAEQRVKLIGNGEQMCQPTCIVADPDFENLIIGTLQGSIFKMGVEREEGEVEGDDEDDGGEKEEEVLNLIKSPLVSLPEGAVVASSSFMLGDVCVYVTASHQGFLSFWKAPEVVTGLPGSGGIKDVNIHSFDLLAMQSIEGIDGPFTVIENLSVNGESGEKMLALGDIFGWLTIVSVNNKLEVNLLKRTKLYDESVTSIRANINNSYVAVSSSESSIIHIMDAGVGLFKILAYVDIQGGALPVCSVWSDSNIWIFTNTASVLNYRMGSDADHPWQLSSEWSVDGVTEILDAISFDNGSVMVYAPNATDATLIKQLPTSTTGGAMSLETVVSTMQEEFNSSILCASSSAEPYLAFGTLDGSIYLTEMDPETNEVKIINRLKLHSYPVITVTFSANRGLVISTASDGSTFVVAVQRPRDYPAVTSSPLPTDIINSLYDASTVSSELWITHRRAEDEVKLRHSLEGPTNDLKEKVQDITNKLNVLLEANEAADELEQLDRLEFVVDLQGKEQTEVANKIAAESVAADYHRRNMKNELIAARIRGTCWDSMESSGRRLLPVSDDYADLFVSPFPIQKYSEEEETRLKRVQRLRAIEIRGLKDHPKGMVQLLPNGSFRCSWQAPVHSLNEDICWISNEGDRWPVADVLGRLEEKASAAEKAKKLGDIEDDDLAKESESLELEKKEVDYKDIFTLLYPPSAIRTEVQKRTQIVLLKEVVRLIKKKFNDRWKKLNSEKEDVIGSIESRNVRINEILAELRTTDELFKPKWANEELEGSALLVDDEEIAARPFETEVMRQARLKEEEERRRREAEKNDNDEKTRALDEMMNGTLDVKVDVFALADSMQKPEWMVDIPYEEMTEIQRKEFDEFEYKINQIQEEQAKYKKSLELELKRLKSEIVDSTKNFDEKLKKMSQLKVIVQREILNHELHISQNSLVMVMRGQAWNTLKSTEKQLNESKAAHKLMVDKVNRVSYDVDNAKTKVVSAQEEIKNLEKSFRRDLQDSCGVSFDQDALKIFTSLYRIRAYPEIPEEYEEGSMMESSVLDSHSKEGSITGDGLVPLSMKSPFFHSLKSVERANLEKTKTIPLKEPLDFDRDCPDGFSSTVDANIWQKLNDLRTARIEREIAEKELMETYIDKKNKLDDLVQDEQAAAKRMEEMRDNIKVVKNELDDLLKNIQVIVSLRQGSDEVDTDAVITDYSKSILIPTNVVDKYNKRVKELGSDKINVMVKIMNFRRKINVVEWESNHTSLEVEHLEEYFTDMQLLRVTRELQRVIREGANIEQAKVRVDKVNIRKDYMTKDAGSKLNKLRSGISAMQKRIESLLEENESLKNNVVDMGKQVEAREVVHKSREDARGPAGDPAVMAMRKMKRVVNRRHLVDTARVQAEELDFLRGELDKVRQRTFPSFVRAAKTRLVNPDVR